MRRYVPGPDSCSAQNHGELTASNSCRSRPRHHLFGMSILARITSDDVLDTTYEWLCRTHSLLLCHHSDRYPVSSIVAN